MSSRAPRGSGGSGRNPRNIPTTGAGRPTIDARFGRNVRKCPLTATSVATSLIENLSGKWTPGKYHDQYRNELLDLLTKKAEGEPLPEPSGEPKSGALDLMDANDE